MFSNSTRRVLADLGIDADSPEVQYAEATEALFDPETSQEEVLSAWDRIVEHMPRLPDRLSDRLAALHAMGSQAIERVNDGEFAMRVAGAIHSFREKYRQT